MRISNRTSGLRGVVVPILTPLNSNEEVDVRGIRRLADFLIERGVDGIFALGTTGEVPRLTPQQRRTVLEATAEAVAGRVPFYAGVNSHGGTRQAIACRKEAEAIGADCTVFTLPYYFRIDDTDEQEEFFLKVADDAEKPVLLYNIPWAVTSSIDLDVAERLSSHPCIGGIKDSRGDAEYLTALSRLRRPGEFSVFCGHDDLLDLARELPLDGVVTSASNVLPASTSEYWRDGGSRLERIRRLNALNLAAPLSSTNGLVVRKLILEHLGIIGSTMTQPHTRFDAAAEARILAFAEEVAEWECAAHASA